MKNRMCEIVFFGLLAFFPPSPAHAVMDGAGHDFFPVAAIFTASATITYTNAENAGLTISSGLVVNNGTIALAASGGNVGIGTASPAATLHVVGQSSFTAAITVNGVYNPTTPRGGIIMYSGAWNFDASGLGTGPLAGWAVCNGNNATPDLSERFIMVSTTSAGLGLTGGSGSHSHTSSVTNKRWRSISTSGGSSAGGYSDTGYMPSYNTANDLGLNVTLEGGQVGTNPAYDPGVGAIAEFGASYTKAVGGCCNPTYNATWERLVDRAISQGNNNPSYYKLAFIMKL